jgi:hypothetical protein
VGERVFREKIQQICMYLLYGRGTGTSVSGEDGDIEEIPLKQ